MGFKLGDKVRIMPGTTYANSPIMEGWLGTVCNVLTSSNEIGVYFEDFIRGHDCDGNCEYGHGWYIKNNQLIIVSSLKHGQILIDSDGILMCIDYIGECLDDDGYKKMEIRVITSDGISTTFPIKDVDELISVFGIKQIFESNLSNNMFSLSNRKLIYDNGEWLNG